MDVGLAASREENVRAMRRGLLQISLPDWDEEINQSNQDNSIDYLEGGIQQRQGTATPTATATARAATVTSPSLPSTPPSSPSRSPNRRTRTRPNKSTAKYNAGDLLTPTATRSTTSSRGTIMSRQSKDLLIGISSPPNTPKALDQQDIRVRTLSQVATATTGEEEEMSDIPDDVYSMFFLSRWFGPAFWYALYIGLLKVIFYTFLTLDALGEPIPQNVGARVIATQFLMLPIAVAIQADMTAFFYTIANVKYSSAVQKSFPHASSLKFYLSNIFRGFDGFFSLLVNIIILLKASSVLALFLNFAALQFLQTIDNIALHLCLDGYLFDRLEHIARQVTMVKLPKRNHQFINSLDTVLFVLTFIGIVLAWLSFHFFQVQIQPK